MTEDEAKTKWCPQYQVNGGTDADDNRSTRFLPETKAYGPSLLNAKCIGSACMAWRWDRELWQLQTDEKGMCLRKEDGIYHGFCGLAGKP